MIMQPFLVHSSFPLATNTSDVAGLFLFHAFCTRSVVLSKLAASTMA